MPKNKQSYEIEISSETIRHIKRIAELHNFLNHGYELTQDSLFVNFSLRLEGSKVLKIAVELKLVNTGNLIVNYIVVDDASRFVFFVDSEKIENVTDEMVREFISVLVDSKNDLRDIALFARKKIKSKHQY